jgi:hypothetical protein
MFYIVFAVVCCLTFCHAGTIPEEAERLGAKTLVKLVTEAGLADTLSGTGKKDIGGLISFHSYTFFLYTLSFLK